MNGYKAFFNGQQIDVYAETSYQAQEKAVIQFKVPKSRRGRLAVMLCETEVPMNKDGTPAGPGKQYTTRFADL